MIGSKVTTSVMTKSGLPPGRATDPDRPQTHLTPDTWHMIIFFQLYPSKDSGFPVCMIFFTERIEYCLKETTKI